MLLGCAGNIIVSAEICLVVMVCTPAVHTLAHTFYLKCGRQLSLRSHPPADPDRMDDCYSVI